MFEGQVQVVVNKYGEVLNVREGFLVDGPPLKRKGALSEAKAIAKAFEHAGRNVPSFVENFSRQSSTEQSKFCDLCPDFRAAVVTIPALNAFSIHLSQVVEDFLRWLGLPFISHGQSKFVTRRGKEFISPNGNPLLLRGINLGNWLLPEGYMFKFKTAGFAYVDSFRTGQYALTKVGTPDKLLGLFAYWQHEHRYGQNR